MAETEFNRVLQTTIRKYVKGAEDNTVRSRKLPSLLKSKGRMTFNHSGTMLDWGVKYKQRQIDGYADGDTLAFARSDNHKRAQVPWRGYTMTDMVTKKERLMNRGREQLIRIFEDMTSEMMKDFGDAFHSQFYVDGNAAGNNKRLMGFDTFAGFSGTVAASLVANPSDTYANLSTALGNYGGSWTGAWPTGVGPSEYDFWSPVLVDYTNSGWTASTKTWPNTCVEAMRYGILRAKRNDTLQGMLDTIFLGGEQYRQWLDLLDDKERVNVNTGKTKGLMALGWGDVQPFEGAEVTWEFGVPTDAAGIEQGYGFNIDEMELCSLQASLFEPEGPFYDEASLSHRFAIHMFGNMKFNPRYFAKWIKAT
jgi:hypothetical protein